MDKTFDFKRFCNVGRWDLTINRTFYTRMFMLVAAIALLPMLFKYIFALWQVIASHGTLDAYIKVNAVDDLDTQVALTNFLLPVMLTVMMAYMFHNLVTRQGRINELTLPATNLERFLWHACLIVGGGLLTALFSIVVADVLHVLLGWAILRQTSFESFTVLVFKNFGGARLFIDGYSTAGILSYLMGAVVLLINYSIFALGSAWRYRYSFAYTLLYMIAASLLFTVVMGFFVSYVVAYVVDLEHLRHFSLHISDTAVAVVTLVLETCFLALVWWLTYRLYCRAQITTRRNP